jgi:hypothetical protein
MGAEGVAVASLDEVGDALRTAVENQKKGKTTVLEFLISKELGDPFRRDAMVCFKLNSIYFDFKLIYFSEFSLFFFSEFSLFFSESHLFVEITSETSPQVRSHHPRSRVSNRTAHRLVFVKKRNNVK